MNFETICRCALIAAGVLTAPVSVLAADAPPAANANCPPWVDYPANDHSNAESPYLGCTNAQNLRSMVENPADLDHGRTLGPADGTREATGVLRYEQGQVTSLPSEEAAAPTLVLQGANAGGTK